MSKDLIKRMSHSSEQSIRDEAVEELHQLIKQGGVQFEDMELKKYFQGIFYCYYHSDKTQYQNELADKITGFMNDIAEEEHKVMWHRYFFKMLAMHWDKLDNWRINKYLSLIRKHVIVVFQHLKSIWNSKNEFLKKYMDAIYEEALKDMDAPLGVGLQLADVYIDEMAANFEKDELTHKRVVAMLNPFLQALGKIHQIALFQRIKEKVFEKLLDSNGIKSDETNELYFPKFDIVVYAENEILSVASSNDIIESRRNDLYSLYEKAAGREKAKEEELPYAVRLRQAYLKNRKPMTKHQKKLKTQLKISKAKQQNQLKKRIIKMLQKKKLDLFSGLNTGDNEDAADLNDNPQTASDEDTAMVSILDMLNNQVKNKAELNGSNGAQIETEDKVVEIEPAQTKKKSKKKKKVVAAVERSSKKVAFALEQNKTKEFYKHSKVGMAVIPKSKEAKARKSSPSGSIIKRAKLV